MINGELIVDNFAGGGTGKSKFAGIMQMQENTEYEDRDRADRANEVCVIDWRKVCRNLLRS